MHAFVDYTLKGDNFPALDPGEEEGSVLDEETENLYDELKNYDPESQ